MFEHVGDVRLRASSSAFCSFVWGADSDSLAWVTNSPQTISVVVKDKTRGQGVGGWSTSGHYTVSDLVGDPRSADWIWGRTTGQLLMIRHAKEDGDVKTKVTIFTFGRGGEAGGGHWNTEEDVFVMSQGALSDETPHG
jgi:hypothetical protein